MENKNGYFGADGTGTDDSFDKYYDQLDGMDIRDSGGCMMDSAGFGEETQNVQPNGGFRQGTYDQQGTYNQPTGYANASRYSQQAYENPSQFTTGQPYIPINQRRSNVTTENVGLGVIGALIGTALGLVVWCIIGMLGYISWIGGLALVAGAFFGYLLLAKDIGKTGMLVVVALVILSVYAGTRMIYAISIHDVLQEEFAGYEMDEEMIEYSNEYLGFDIDASTSEIFMNLDDYINAVDGKKEFNGDLATGYLFTGLASLAFVVNRLKRR